MIKLLPSQIRAILTALNQKLTYRDIEHQLNVSKSTVDFIRNQCVNTGRNLDEILKLNDSELHDLIYPLSRSKPAEPDWQHIYSQLGRRGVTLQMLFELYQKENPSGAYSYASFCRRYVQWNDDNGIHHIGGNVDRIPRRTYGN